MPEAVAIGAGDKAFILNVPGRGLGGFAGSFLALGRGH